MKLQLGLEIISSYKRLAYQPWFALAEFVDNSTQAYFNNRAALDKVYRKTKTNLEVDISTGISKQGRPYIKITDNSIGMSEAELTNAVIIGKPPRNKEGRSRYGLGLKTGASWFGDLWKVETKKLGERVKHTVIVNVQKIAEGEDDLPHTKESAPEGDHYTIITIFKLHNKIAGRTVAKIREYLSSIYRVDITSKRLRLTWNGDALSWDSEIDKKLSHWKGGKLVKKSFSFKVAGKRVTGWAGVLKNGSRSKAGFSIIQADRVITGYPKAYRPSTLFGQQEGGSNDLINQRLLGELYFHGFEVSHTKDLILFEDDDQEVLESILLKKLSGLRQFALLSNKDADARLKTATDKQRAVALNSLRTEMKSERMKTFMKTFEVPSEGLIGKINESLKNSIVKRFSPDLKTKINKLLVSVYLVKDMSPNDPYVIIESTASDNAVVVIINLVHPHWFQLTKDESILNFIRHCTYDGVAEWKAYSEMGTIEPNTVKLIKDNLLRIPMILEDAK